MKLLLAVSGGIAVYKACTLTSLAVKAGHEVRVMMTVNATRFVAPLTFEALSGSPALLDLFGGAGSIDHVAWAKWADAAVVAPCTANVMGKLACGIADDVVSTVLMAFPRGRPIILAPAMNTEMWLNPVVERNRQWLESLGRYHIMEPVEKRLACGDVGPGALPEPQDILQFLERSSLQLL